MPTATETKTWISEIDIADAPMERPFMRVFVQGVSEEDATASATKHLDAGEVIRRVVPLQPILDAVVEGIAQGKRYSIGWKHEGREGPVWIIDIDAMEEAVPAREDGARVSFVPFGSDPTWETTLPWMRRVEAKRLASYLGLPLEES